MSNTIVLLIFGCILFDTTYSVPVGPIVTTTVSTIPVTLPPPTTEKPKCDNRDCMKNLINEVRGAVISSVNHLIVVVESEHLPQPPPCPNPNCGITLPDTSDFLEDDCIC